MSETPLDTSKTDAPQSTSSLRGLFARKPVSESYLVSVRSGTFARIFGNPLLLGILTILSFVLITHLSLRVIQDVRDLRQSTIEDIEWTLNETEIEFLSFQYALRKSLHGSSNSFVALRREFDIFQNRIHNLKFGAVYEPLRQVPGFDPLLDKIEESLHDFETTLRGSDQSLSVNLKEVETRSIALAPAVRRMASIGQANLHSLLDRQQLALSTTLKVLAVASSILMTTLGLLAFYFNRLRRQSEERRRRLITEMERNRAVTSTSLDGVIVSDERGVIQEFNHAAEEIFGYESSHAIGRTVGELLVPNSHREAHDRGINRVLNGGGFHIVNKGRVRLEARRANGDCFPMEMALQSSDNHGKPMFIAFVRDISYRVRAERDLIEARDQALAGEKAKSRFLAVMSHEIRTPMNGMLGNMSLLKETELTEEQRGYLAKMETSGSLLMDHVNDVLDIARYEDGKPVVRYRPTALRRVVESAIDSQRSAAEANGNRLLCHWNGPERDWVKSDPGRVQQVLINLLSNAIKFTEHGRITVEVSTSDDHNMVEFKISDTGIGIAETDQDRIFEDFVTHDDSFSRKTEGTGLGLGIVRRIVAALNGEITLHSAIGQGSCFIVTLPMPLTTAPETLSETVSPALVQATDLAERKGLNVLVVEDNEINRDVVRAMLTREGHEVVEAVDGKSGVEIASSRPFDLILMDISMPVLDGRAATQQIRSGKGASSGSPIVALTAHVLPENVTEFLAMGMQDVLPKPLMRPDLQRIIRAHTAHGEAANSDDAPSCSAHSPKKRLVDKDTNQALRESVGDAYAMLLSTMTKELHALVEWLEDDTLDLPEISARCHKHASSAAVFGADPLRKLLIEMEMAGKEGDHNRLALRREMLPQLLADTLKQLTEEGADAA